MPSELAAQAFEALRLDIEEHCRRAFGTSDAKLTTFEPMSGGHSGFTYLVRITGSGLDRRLVIRIAPPGARPRGPADVSRQGRIMAALHAEGVPVPSVPVIVEAQETVSGRPFIAMDEVAGQDIDETALSMAPDRLLEAAVRALRAVQEVPLGRLPFADSPVDLSAELERWGWLMDRGPEDLTARSRWLLEALSTRRPAERQPCLVHGDYHFGNMIFRKDAVAAIVDWEIAEVGQPLLDFASLAVFALRRRFRGEPNPGGVVAISPEQVAEHSGAPKTEFAWYVALGCYKYSAILGYNLRLHLSGKRPDPIYPQLIATIYGLLEAGIEILHQA